jgi:hypothetical protein
MVKIRIRVRVGLVKMSKELYAYYLYSPRPDYGTTPVFYHRDFLPESGFASLYAVTKDTAEAIVQAGSAAGFKGVVWSERLWIDVDSYERADTTESKLKERGYDYVSYDTGGRGAHFGVLRSNGPSHLLPQQDKQWVQEHFPEADVSIYSHLHPFRLPGTPHQRTGNRKTFVSSQGGETITLSKPTLRDRLFKGQGQGKSNTLLSSARTSVFDIHFIQRNSEPAKEGERHAQLVRLAYALRDSGYSIDIARWWCGEVNKRFSPPKTEEEIEKALGSIYR